MTTAYGLDIDKLLPIEPWPRVPGVYFVECGFRIKIGVSRNIAARLLRQKTFTPEPLLLLAFVPGDKTVETEIHLRFAQFRQHGEWFSKTREIVAEIRKIRGLPPPRGRGGRPRTGSLSRHVMPDESEHWDIRITLPSGKRTPPICTPRSLSEKDARALAGKWTALAAAGKLVRDLWA